MSSALCVKCLEGPFLTSNPRRVILRRFFPSKDNIAESIIAGVLKKTNEVARIELDAVLKLWGDRHQNLLKTFAIRFGEVEENMDRKLIPEEEKAHKEYVMLLLGAHFMHEYSIEAAALFNPSVVFQDSTEGPIPLLQGDSSSVGGSSSRKLILSVRATGEQHVSSIVFRTATVTIDSNRKIAVILDDFPGEVPLETGNVFSLPEGDGLEVGGSSSASTDGTGSVSSSSTKLCVAKRYRNPFSGSELPLANGNFVVRFSPKTTPQLSQRVLFPSTPQQKNGIEDARFVKLTGAAAGDAEDSLYIGTFTAYDGNTIDPQVVHTKNFLDFTFLSLKGKQVSNKGFAFFPRRINGKVYVISRQDDENILIMSSESLFTGWDDASVLMTPEYPWEQVKIGNCGSPIETPYGWLLLTHGVGPMRRYCIGAALLDLNDPSKVIGRLATPLLEPSEAEREGYVPSVVYTCGALLVASSPAGSGSCWDGVVLVPYAVSDSSSAFAYIPSVKAVIDAMETTTASSTMSRI